MNIEIDKNQTTYIKVYIYKVYNLSFRNYDAIYNKESSSTIATTLRISNENVLIENFNFYYII